MGGDRRRRSIAVVGVLAAITGLSGVSAATSAGGDRPSFSRTAVASPASVSPTTTTTVDEPVAAEAPSTSTTSSSIPRSTTTTAAVGTATGRVVYHDGQPVAGAKVTLSGSPNRDVLTDSAGRYRFPGLAPGTYELELWAESAAAPCQPSDPCIGSAVALESRLVTVGAGETQVEDWVYPYDSSPTYSDASGLRPDSATTTSSTITPSTTTTTR